MTGKLINAGGVPLITPNDIICDNKDFYVSYNNRDIAIYGDETTALVSNKPLKFFILNGNHTKQYNDIISNGGVYDDCLKYFEMNIDKISKFSDKLDEEIIVNEDGSLLVKKIIRGG